MRASRWGRCIIVCRGAVLAACGGDATSPGAAPHVVAASVAVNPINALAGVVTFSSEGADSARVLYWAAGEGPAKATPYYPVTGGGGEIATLGLKPGKTYHNLLELVGGRDRATSAQLDFTTGTLPAELQRVTLTTTGTAGPGFTLTTVTVDGTAFVLAFDSTGQILWYRAFPGGLPSVEAKQQRSGNFTVYLGGSAGWQPGPGSFVEFTPGGQLLRTFAAPAPFLTDPHELWLTADADGQERAHFFSYDIRTVDISGFGGPSAASLAGHQLLRLIPDGPAEFSWNGWDYIKLADWVEPPLPTSQTTSTDFDHPNSLDFDRDGNYIVSFRNLGEVMKLDARTGAIIWILGGVNNQFTIFNDPLGGFSGQHSVRVLPNGHLLIYDNGNRHQPQETRAVEYALNAAAKTATLVWQFRHNPIIHTPFLGSVQRLSSGNTLIGYGNASRAIEVSPQGTALWEAEIRVDGQLRAVYRFIRVASLYRYEVP
jgi:outer membrane protein assembly factor BamB